MKLSNYLGNIFSQNFIQSFLNKVSLTHFVVQKLFLKKIGSK